LFASEIKALLQGAPRTEINVHALDAYMIYGFVPGEETLWRGIKKLPAGHTLTLADRWVEPKPYWDLDFVRGGKPDEVHCTETLFRLLHKTARTHLRSDVPVGVLLSGGLDSSTVTALVREVGHKQIKTFSVAFNYGPRYNETSYARSV